MLTGTIDALDEGAPEMPEWSGYLVSAWNALTNDRHHGDMGGVSGIYYQSISAYARDHGLDGDAFHDFEGHLRVMDGEYVAYCAERAKEAAEKAKREQQSP